MRPVGRIEQKGNLFHFSSKPTDYLRRTGHPDLLQGCRYCMVPRVVSPPGVTLDLLPQAVVLSGLSAEPRLRGNFLALLQLGFRSPAEWVSLDEFTVAVPLVPAFCRVGNIYVTMQRIQSYLHK